MLKRIKLFFAALTVFVLIIVVSGTALAQQLTDIKGHWAEEYIKHLVGKGIISGDEKGAFKPGNNITVAEFAKMVVKAKGIEYDATNGYWYEGIIEAAKDAGIIHEGEFDNYHKRLITRAEMARMISRALGVASESNVTSFSDDYAIPEEMKTYINAATECQIINGMAGNTFKPNNRATRAEAATMIARMLEYMEQNKDNLVKKKASNGIIPAMKDGKWGFVDESGQILVDFQYDNVWGVHDDMYCALSGYDVIYICYSNGKDLIRTFVGEDMGAYISRTYNVDLSNILNLVDAKSNYIIFRAACITKFVRPYEEALKAEDPGEYQIYEFFRERAYDLEAAKSKAKAEAYDRAIDYWDQKMETWPDSFRYGN